MEISLFRSFLEIGAGIGLGVLFTLILPAFILLRRMGK
jgi:hypothetical protein